MIKFKLGFSKRLKIFGIFFGALFVISLGFNNCVKSNLEGGIEASSEIFGENPLEPEGIAPVKSYIKKCEVGRKLSPSQKMQKMKSLRFENKVSSDLLKKSFSAGTNFVVVADNECLEKEGSKTLISEIVLQSILETMNSKKLLNQAFPVSFPRAYTGLELNEIMLADDCLLQLNLNEKLSLFSSPNDPRISEQAHLTSVNFSNSYDGFFNSKNGITEPIRLAIIDSGIDPTHPDLNENVLRDANNNVFGFNPISNQNQMDVIDSGFHGTHVAGIAAAVGNNNVGITGVMGKNIKIMPIKVSVDGSSVSMDAVVNGIRWAAENDADVINMSLGGTTLNPLLTDAIEFALKKNVTIVVAAGNDSKQLSSTFAKYPAQLSMNYLGMLTVGSVDATTKSRSSFSNYSSTFVELMAPGSNSKLGILSTVPLNLSASGYAKTVSINGSTQPIEGTSMASPVVAGAAALIIGLARSRGYDILPSQVERVLREFTTKSTPLVSFAAQGAILDLSVVLQKLNTEMNINGLVTPRESATGVVGILTQPESQTIKEGTQGKISVLASVNSSIVHSYKWYKNGILIRNANQPDYLIEKVDLSDGAEYFVELSAGNAKVQSQKVDIIVEELCED